MKGLCMKVQIKRTLTLPLLALSMTLATPNTTKAITIPSLKNSALFGAVVLAFIPLLELQQKSSKRELSPEEEYSWQEIKQAIQTKNWNLLWKNIKNLYHTGFVGQVKYNSGWELKEEEGILRYRRSSPARGILGKCATTMKDIVKSARPLIYFAGLLAVSSAILNDKIKTEIIDELKKFTVKVVQFAA